MLLHTDRYETFDKDLDQVPLPGHRIDSHPIGYITPSGTVFECAPYRHLSMLEQFFTRDGGYFQETYEEFKEWRWKNHDLSHSFGSISIYDEFVLAELGWVKIAAYGRPGSSGPMEDWEYDFYLIRTQELTPEQINVIYPR